jgi:hypothetical protein
MLLLTKDCTNYHKLLIKGSIIVSSQHTIDIDYCYFNWLAFINYIHSANNYDPIFAFRVTILPEYVIKLKDFEVAQIKLLYDI